LKVYYGFEKSNFNALHPVCIL